MFPRAFAALALLWLPTLAWALIGDTPLAFEVTEPRASAPPYPSAAIGALVTADDDGDVSEIESFGLWLVEAKAVDSTAGELPLELDAKVESGGAEIGIEMRWTPAGGEPFPLESRFDVRVGLGPSSEHTPTNLRDANVGSFLRRLVASFAAELKDQQGQLVEVYASHFVELALGPSLPGEITDAGAEIVDELSPELRITFRVKRDEAGSPAPGDPILVGTVSGTLEDPAFAPLLSLPTLALLAGLLLATALLLRRRSHRY